MRTNSSYHLWPSIEDYSLHDNEIHLWLIHLPKSITQARFEALHLLKQERKLILTDILKRYTQMPFLIHENAHGKPFLNTKELAFSTSHSGSFLAIALSKNEIGLDIEQYRTRDFVYFSKGFFKNDLQLESLPRYLQGRCFYQEWVQTEALVKFQGQTIFNYTHLNENEHHTVFFEPQVGLMAAIMHNQPHHMIRKMECHWQTETCYREIITALHEKDIQEQLQTKNLKLYCLKNVDSTQDFIKRLPDCKDMIICQSDVQTQARGRFGRAWVSPPDVNLYVSIRQSVQLPAHELEGLSIVMGMAIAKMLKIHLGIQTQIKWPNDIYYQGKKLAGILIECIKTTTRESTLIIGIGLNVNAKAEFLPETATSLYEIHHQRHDKISLLKQSITYLYQAMTQFEQQGFKSFLNEWKNYDLLYQEQICIQQGQKIFSGIAIGVNEKGYLMIRDQNHQIQEVGSGEASIQSFTKKD